jgi:uncharacterized protein YjbI with pentapeptide repeats
MGAKLSGSDLREAVLGPLLIGADRMLPCDMTRCVAKGTDFSNADLHHAVMVFADISRANFTGASLKQADLSGAHRPNTRGLELTAVAKGATA